jgi:hypothetical protein
MYALAGVARAGATRAGYVSSRTFISIDGAHFIPPTEPGHVGILLDSLRITDELDDTPNTCTFRVNGAVPVAGSEVRITIGSKNGQPFFAGFALTVQQLYVADKPANIQADVSCVDYTWFFGFVKVTQRYRNQSATAIATDLIARYAAVNGFTAAGIAPGLPVLDELTYTNEDLDAAFTRLARRIGGYWYVDYTKGVHLFFEETGNGAPETLTPQHKSLDDFVNRADRTQVLTRVYVEGRGTSFLGPVNAGDTKIPLEAVDMFAVAPDVFAKVSPQGSEGGAQHLTFTGVVPGGAGSLVGPGTGPPGPPTLTPAVGTGLGIGVYHYAYTQVTASGETLPSPVAAVAVGTLLDPPTVAPTPAPFAVAGGVNAGAHWWAYSFTSGGGGETTLSPGVSIDTRTPVAPTGGIAHINDFLGGGPFPPSTAYDYAVTYIGAAGGETTAAPYTYGFLTGNFAGGHYTQLFIGRDTGGANPPAYKCPPGITGIKVYRTRAIPFGAPRTQFYFVGNATVQSDGAGSLTGFFEDWVPDSSLSVPIPTTNTALAGYGTIRVTLPTGGAGVAGRKLYRTLAGTTTWKFVATIDNVVTYYDDVTPDGNLGAAPPTTNTAGTEYRGVDVSAIAVGPAAVTSRKLYRTLAGGLQHKLVTTLADNTTTVYADRVPDASLGANMPTGDTSGLQQVPGQVPAGSPSMLVATIVPFETAGGWAVIGNGEQVIRYTGKTGNTITGIPPTGLGAITAGVSYNSTVTAAPMLTGVATLNAPLVKGDEIYLVVQRDHAARQTALADMVNVGPGIREEWVQDRRLSIPEARARGDATLALRPLEDVTVQYRCRDLRTASGKTITVNLPAPTNVQGAFKIQSVTIDNFRPYPTQYPTFTVTASSRHFNFEDWLRRMETSS